MCPSPATPVVIQAAQRRNVTVSVCASSSQKAGDMIEMATSDGLLCYFLKLFFFYDKTSHVAATLSGPLLWSVTILTCSDTSLLEKVTSRFFPDGRSLTRRRSWTLAASVSA